MVVLIPAHSEEASIAAMLNALMGQSRVPDRIVVIADNCTDRTEQIARRFAAQSAIQLDPVRHRPIAWMKLRMIAVP